MDKINIRSHEESNSMIAKYIVKKYLVYIVSLCIFCIYILWQNSTEKRYHESLNKINSIVNLMNENSKRSEILIKQQFQLIENQKTLIEKNDYNSCQLIPLNSRFDCHPENGASELLCIQRGCCWDTLHEIKYRTDTLNIPYCYYPENWSLYKYENFSKGNNDFSAFLRLTNNSFYKNDIPLIKMESSSIDDTTLRVKIFDPLNKRYEPPFPIRSDSQPFLKKSNDALYTFEMNEHIYGFNVIRTSDKRSVFHSLGLGGFIFADQFLQISSILPSHNIYGLGEHRSNLKLNTNWQKFTLFNADQPPIENANLYGSHPFYMVIEETGKAHGVLFLNSNAMDIILQSRPAITFRTIGGIFDIYFFMGPTPADVLKQYSKIVGKPFLPPYWSLGFHLCRFGYGSLENTKAVWQRTRDALIPFDTQWNDLDYMDNNNDFTYDKQKFKDLPNFIKEIHAAGMHYIPIIDAGVSASDDNGTYFPYDEGVRRDVFVHDEHNDTPFKGKVWNRISTTWPDFTNPNTISYYTEMMQNMHNDFEYDGAWIDMNEPSNFYNGHINGCDSSPLNYPPYLPNVIDKLLSRKTLCMNAKQHLGYHYNLHNVYGTSQAVVVNYALTKIRKKRPFIISRSSWEGHGFYAGHWTGDVYSLWHDLKMSIPEILAYSLFQIPMVGADICGFNGNTTEELCNRWMQLGAFYPFSRNHNSDDTIEQDPVAMGQMVVMSSKKALNIRYSLLPYLYTLFYHAHIYGETVARPLFIEFYKDPLVLGIDTQFLWGACLMIIPVLEEGKTEVNAYIPKGVWYDYYSMNSLDSVGTNITLEAPLDTIPLLIRGGCVLPIQEPGVTTTMSRQKPFNLLVALNTENNAKGNLYWDDGDSLDSIKKKQYKLFEFQVKNNKLISNVKGFYNENLKLSKITIMGLSEIVHKVVLNNKSIQFKYDQKNSILKLENLYLNFSQNFVLTWLTETSSINFHNAEDISFHEIKQDKNSSINLTCNLAFIFFVLNSAAASLYMMY